MFIAAVKPVVPLEGLRLMFGIQEGSYALCTAYDYFCDEFENMLFAAFGVAPAAQGLGETRSAAKDLLRNTVSAIVNKIYLDRYLSDYQDRLAQERSPRRLFPRKRSACAQRKITPQLKNFAKENAMTTKSETKVKPCRESIRCSGRGRPHPQPL